MQSQGSTPLHYISASSSKPCWQSIGPAGISPHIGVEHNLTLRTCVCVCMCGSRHVVGSFLATNSTTLEHRLYQSGRPLLREHCETQRPHIQSVITPNKNARAWLHECALFILTPGQLMLAATSEAANNNAADPPIITRWVCSLGNCTNLALSRRTP